MKPETKKNLSMLILVALSLALVSGCGSSSSSAPAAATDATTLATGSTLSCNAYSNSDVQFYLESTSTSGASGLTDLRLKFTSLPASYYSGEWDIRVSAWTAGPGGNTYPDANTPQHLVNIRFDLMSGGAWEQASEWGFNMGTNCSEDDDECPTLQWEDAQVVEDFENNEESASITSDAGFWNVNSMLMDLNATAPSTDSSGNSLVISSDTNPWKAIRVEFIDSTGTVQRSADILAPPFAADPNVYSQSHPAVLNTLHPFNSVAGQGWSLSQYISQGSSYCF